MKVLWIARTCPFPPNDGEKIRVFNLLKNLSKHDQFFICRTMNEEEQEGIIELRKYCTCVEGVYIPSPRSYVEKAKWLMPFVFSEYPISMSTVYFQKIARVLQRWCNENEFDIIQVEHSSLSIYLDGLTFRNKPKKIVTMHNIDYIRNDRIISNLPFGFKKMYQIFNQARFKEWELDCLNCYDRILTMSDVDRGILIKESPTLQIDIVPNGVDIEGITFKPQKRQDFSLIFVASMDPGPNHDAALYFLNDIFPAIKKEVDATVYFVGRNPQKDLLDFHNGSDVIVTGKVPDVFDYYQKASVCIVPLRSGGGTRLKILEAMAVGVPVVSTSVGCEGLNIEHEKHLLIADGPENFSGAVLRLLKESDLRDTLIDAARKKVEQEYDWRSIAKSQSDIYESLGFTTASNPTVSK